MTDDVIRFDCTPERSARRAGQRLGDRLVWPLAGISLDRIRKAHAVSAMNFSRLGAAASRAAEYGVRVVCLRSGLGDRDRSRIADRECSRHSNSSWRRLDRQAVMSWITAAISLPDRPCAGKAVLSGPIQCDGADPVTTRIHHESSGRRPATACVFRILGGAAPACCPLSPTTFCWRPARHPQTGGLSTLLFA